jgi:hypothetical protein
MMVRIPAMTRLMCEVSGSLKLRGWENARKDFWG